VFDSPKPEAFDVKLRAELMPIKLDEAKVRQLAGLADKLDGRNAGWKQNLAKFNRLAGTNLTIDVFQGIYAAEDHETWVRRILAGQSARPVANVTRKELIEVIRRAMPQNEFADEHEAYMAIFDANVPMPNASNLIFYPPDYDETTNTWNGGRSIGEYDPTPEEILEIALNWKDKKAKPRRGKK
jgi:hypothetical protein